MKGDIALPNGPVIPGRFITFTFSRSGGPGGQNVNKVETRVELRFALDACDVLSPAQRALILTRLGGRRIATGELLFACDTHRERGRNASEVVDRFREAIGRALIPPRPRRATQPTRGSVKRRLVAKKQRGVVKRDRQAPPDGD